MIAAADNLAAEEVALNCSPTKAAVVAQEVVVGHTSNTAVAEAEVVVAFVVEEAVVGVDWGWH